MSAPKPNSKPESVAKSFHSLTNAGGAIVKYTEGDKQMALTIWKDLCQKYDQTIENISNSDHTNTQQKRMSSNTVAFCFYICILLLSSIYNKHT